MRFVLVDDARLHHEGHLLQYLDVGEWITLDRDDVRPLAGFERAYLVGPAHQVGGVQRGCLQGGQGRHPKLGHVYIQLMRVETVGVDRGVGSAGYLDSCLDGADGVLLLDRAYVLHLLGVERGQVAVLLHPVDEVGRGHKVGAVLEHHGNVGIVHVAAVLDGIDSGLGGPENRLRTMRVGGYLAAEPVGVGDDGLHLFQRVLAGLRVVALGEHAAGRANFDQVGAVLDVVPDHVLHAGDAISNTSALHVVLLREEVLVHVSAGNAERWAGDLHVRAGDVSLVNFIAQCDVGEAVRSYVAHRGETCVERGLCVLYTNDRFLAGSHRELEVGIEVGCHGEVGVDVDEAGQQGVTGEIDDAVAGLGGRRAGGGDGDNFVALHDDGLIGRLLAGVDVDDVAGAQEGSSRSGLVGGLSDRGGGEEREGGE